jgi:hypothetical protein
MVAGTLGFDLPVNCGPPTANGPVSWTPIEFAVDRIPAAPVRRVRVASNSIESDGLIRRTTPVVSVSVRDASPLSCACWRLPVSTKVVLRPRRREY